MYCKVDNNFVKVHDDKDISEYDINKLVIGEIYKSGGKYFVFQGDYIEGTHDNVKGIFRDFKETKDALVPYLITNAQGDGPKIIASKFQEQVDIKDLFTSIHKLNAEKNKKQKASTAKKNLKKSLSKKKSSNTTAKPKSTLNKTERTKRENIIHVEIDEADDTFVRVVKDILNESNVTLVDLYDYFGERTGYNMYYGICTRNSIAEASIAKWCDFLNCEYTLTIKRN